jgi:hypothetical protein
MDISVAWTFLLLANSSQNVSALTTTKKINCGKLCKVTAII